ncbi:MAG: 4Fe-4S dicluster domain-containing protein [Alkaliphilus sp.]
MGQAKMIDIYVMGKKYEVPSDLTVMQAMEYSGYKLIRGCGCRGGFCGACGTVYRTPDDFRIKVGLACQMVVEKAMQFIQIPFFPANKKKYDVDELNADLVSLMKLYPEISRCVGCNTCTKGCPQDIKVMDYMAAAIRGDIESVAKLSFDCIMCGLCASRCPAEEVQYYVAILARRLYARHAVPSAGHLADKVKEIEEGSLDEEMSKLVAMSKEELENLYNNRDIEK